MIDFVCCVGMFLAFEIFTIMVVKGWWTGRK